MHLVHAVEEIVKNLNKPKDPYDSYVPIIEIEKDSRYAVHLLDNIVGPDVYSELLDLLRNADDTVTITFYICSDGGYAATANVLYYAIKNTKATTYAVCSGVVASAASIISFACDSFEIAPTTAFLIHEGTAGFSGKPSDMRKYQDFSEAQQKAFFIEVYGDILSEEEIIAVLDNEELWLMGYDVAARLANAGRTVIKEGY